MFAVMFAGPGRTWRDLAVLGGAECAQERRARIDPPSLETDACTRTPASNPDPPAGVSREPAARSLTQPLGRPTGHRGLATVARFPANGVREFLVANAAT